MTDDIGKWTDNQLIEEYMKPGLALLAHPKVEEILSEMRKRGILERAQSMSYERAKNHVATYGNYRT